MKHTLTHFRALVNGAFLSHEEAAKIAGVSLKHIKNMVNGSHKPTTTTYNRIVNYSYNISEIVRMVMYPTVMRQITQGDRPALKEFVIVIYNDPDYQTRFNEAYYKILPFASSHFLSTMWTVAKIPVSAACKVKLVILSPERYNKWLNGRVDTPISRLKWAATDRKYRT